MKAILFYIFSYIVLTIYGVEVCPYLDGLGFYATAINLLIFFIITFIIRIALIKKVVYSAPLGVQPNRQLAFDLGLFIFTGIAIGVYDSIYLGFPVESALKVILGTTTLGFFASLDLVFERERYIIKKIQNSRETFTNNSSKFFSLPKKFAIVSLFLAVFISSILLLLVIKDFVWLAKNVNAKGINVAQADVIKEIIFAAIIIFGLAINLIISYSRNLKLYFSSETMVLENVSNGDLNGYVPIFTNDEFGLIAHHTNYMIDGLKEKERIKNIFGKVVSPEIAKRLIDEGETRMGGTRKTLVILFSDIRNFTSLAENTEPEILVQNLNLYFSKMVEIITNCNGLVDKFIGDGILAVFGLENESTSVNNAVEASIKMQMAVKNLKNDLNISMGIGLHKGELIAGIIGSPDRLEFSFIGDVVNTASRIEGMTRQLQTDILISKEIKEELSPNMKLLPWKDFGVQSLKGKKYETRLFGIPKHLSEKEKDYIDQLFLSTSYNSEIFTV